MEQQFFFVRRRPFFLEIPKSHCGRTRISRRPLISSALVSLILFLIQIDAMTFAHAFEGGSQPGSQNRDWSKDNANLNEKSEEDGVSTAEVETKVQSAEEAAPVREKKRRRGGSKERKSSRRGRPSGQNSETDSKVPASFGFRSWAGAGASYIQHRQTRSGSGKNLSFETIEMPSSYVDMDLIFFNRLRVLLVSQQAPGVVENRQTIQVLNRQYAWKVQSLDLAYSPSSWKWKVFGFATQWGVRLGAQTQQIPMIEQTQETEYLVNPINVSLAAVGGDVSVKLSQYWRMDLFMRYQHLFDFPGKKIQIETPLVFDGSIGVYRLVGSYFRTGVFWYGEYMDYQFKKRESFESAIVEGSQNLLSSTLEFRFGFQF